MRQLFAAQRARARALRGSTRAERAQKLEALAARVAFARHDIRHALRQDLGRPPVETDLSETMVVLQEIKHTLAQLGAWMGERTVFPTLPLFGTASRVRREPKGVCLIIAPWNLPVALVLGPLVGAVAAGNAVCVRPSELAPHSAALLTRIIRDVFSEDEVSVYEGGGSEVPEALLQLPFDHVFFTGSTEVGKRVMTAAAAQLASVTLELGGQCPTIVDAHADVAHAARAIAYGKFQNAGQACIAPDHLWVHEHSYDALRSELTRVLDARYGAPAEHIRSPDLGRIVNERHYARITGLVDDATARGARLSYGGRRDAATRFIGPTLLEDVPLDARIRGEEVFGPVLPVHRYAHLGALLDELAERPTPLAMYVFSRERAVVREVIERTRSGDVGVNTCLLHFTHPGLPFGGQGASGLGKAHGEATFAAFSHTRSVLEDRFASSGLAAPPYGKASERLASFLLRVMKPR